MKIIITENQLEYLMDKKRNISSLIESFFYSYTYPKYVIGFEIEIRDGRYYVVFIVSPKLFNKSKYLELLNYFYEIRRDLIEMAPIEPPLFGWRVHK